MVVVAGSPALPLTRSLALDLERKGYIVFIVCNSVEDEALVHNMARTDVKALGIDIADVSLGIAGTHWGHVDANSACSLQLLAHPSSGSHNSSRRLTHPCHGRKLIFSSCVQSCSYRR